MQAVATVRTISVPGGLDGFDIERTLFPPSINVNCRMPGCSSLKMTC